MATKLRNLGTSVITKIILWLVIITFGWFFFISIVSICRTSEQQNLPINSLETMDYADSYDLMMSCRDIQAALYWKYDINKLYNIENLPTLYYRAEHEDGSVITNVTGKDAEFFKSHKVHGIYQSLPNGSWQEISASEGWQKSLPNKISYGQVQVFNDSGHSHAQSYPSSDTYFAQSNIFALPIPKNVPDIVAWQIYGGDDGYDYSSYTNSLGATVTYREAQRNDSSAVQLPGGDSVDISQFTDAEIEAQYQQWLKENPIPTATIYYAFDDTSLATYQGFWVQCRNYFISQLGILLGIGLVMLAAAIWLLVVSGRRPADTQLHLLPTDHIWSEITLGVGFLSIFCLGSLVFAALPYMIYNKIYNDAVMVNIYCVGFVVLSVVTLAIAMSLIRLLKAHRLIRNSLTFKVCYWCWQPVKHAIDALRSCFDERSFKDYPLTKALQRRQMAYLGALGGLLALMLFFVLVDGGAASFFLSLILIACLAGISYWHVKGNLKTYKEINKGFNESLDEQMKSERTKTALITNVSHDLKTPLTSIITYVDLLSKEELPDSARDYVTVLAQKSERLKSIVADLFDLSKSASGNIPLDMETLDLKRLIEQTLADMRDHIDASELIIKVKLPDEEVNIYSDGKKLYRVFQNIIDNALKYSMVGTRVFVTLENESGKAVATIKNTAAYEMDFTADDVLQRFSRGDKSRTSEGSGLGLSIAESFTRACGGDFKVELDGDLFKVTIVFTVK